MPVCHDNGDGWGVGGSEQTFRILRLVYLARIPKSNENAPWIRNGASCLAVMARCWFKPPGITELQKAMWTWNIPGPVTPSVYLYGALCRYIIVVYLLYFWICESKNKTSQETWLAVPSLFFQVIRMQHIKNGTSRCYQHSYEAHNKLMSEIYTHG